MQIRSHIGRPLDFSLPSNRAIVGLTVAAAVVSTVVWVAGGELVTLWAAAHVYLTWGLVREIDPDHQWTALVAGASAGLWVLAGNPATSILAVAGFLLAGRFVLNSTGRRPLPFDLLVAGLLAAAISFTRTGFIAGFGLAIGIYIDERLAEEDNPAGVLTAGLAALGASVVATAAQAFPSVVPQVRPVLVAAVGVLALVAIIREPETPLSLVDSRRKTPLRQDRLHGTRSLVAVLVFIAAGLAGESVTEMVPLIIALPLVLISNEVERWDRLE